MKLDPFFQQVGMAYHIVPMETKNTIRSVDTEKMYDNVMNKFKWGGVDQPGVYLDENVMRMCKVYRVALFSKLENVPLDYSALSIGEFYYELGQKEKGEAIFSGIADDAVRTVNWIFRLKPGQFASAVGDLEHNLAVLQEVLRVAKKHDPELAQKYQEEFDNYRMAYGSIVKE